MEEARYFGMGGVTEDQLNAYIEVPKEVFLSIIGKAEDKVDQEGKSEHLRVLVQGYTDLMDANYKAAFVGSWTIIESYCKTQNLVSKGASFPEAYKSAKKMRSSPLPVFKELDRLRHFEKPKSKDFSRLYDIRSRVVHSRMYIPSREEAFGCYSEAEQLVRRELSFQ